MLDRFGEAVAARYDESLPEMFAPEAVEPAVDFLVARADGGPVLELGIGTGRIALPLAARGIAVHGIDLSGAMVAKLRAKPGADAIGVTIGDFASTRVERTFRLAYLVFNTIMNLTSQDEQVACFENVAHHLEPGGRFVVEVAVPALRRLPPGERFRVFGARPGYLGVDEHDVATQGLVSHHWSEERGPWSLPFRYVWPAELDLMARIAGMRLAERFAGWNEEPFGNESEHHVSVWEKVA